MPSTLPPPADALPRQSVRDPDLWVTAAAWGVVAFALSQILLFSFGRDQGIYAVVGAGILDGKMPYRDLWDFKPPGIHLLYALAQGLLGRTMLAPRLIEAAALLGLVFAFRRLSFEWLGTRLPGLLAGALALLVHAELEFWHTGQPEIFGGIVTAFALSAVVGERFPRQRPLAWCAAGTLFGIAFLMKPPLGGGAVVLAAYLFTRRQQRGATRREALLPALVMAGCFAAVLLACCAWLWLGGAGPAARWTFIDYLPGYTHLGWQGASAPELFYRAFSDTFVRFSALLPAGVVAALLLPPIYGREREALFLLLGLLAVQAAGIAMQGKFFPYHYSASLLLVAFIAGLGFYKLWRRLCASGTAGMLAFAAFALMVGSMRSGVRELPQGFWWRSGARLSYLLGVGDVATREMLDQELYHVADFDLNSARRLALDLRRRAASEEAVFLWGFEPVVYWMAERSPASRFIYDVAQRGSWQAPHAIDELMQDLERSKPAVVAVQHGDVMPEVTGDGLDSASALSALAPLSSWLSREYSPAGEVDAFDIYERRAETLPRAGAPLSAP